MEKRKVEVFTAGCPVCEPMVAIVKALAGSNCEVTVHDTRGEGAGKALEYGVKILPAVAVDGYLVNCCADPGPSLSDLRGAGIGQPLDSE